MVVVVVVVVFVLVVVGVHVVVVVVVVVVIAFLVCLHFRLFFTFVLVHTSTQLFMFGYIILDTSVILGVSALQSFLERPTWEQLVEKRKKGLCKPSSPSRQSLSFFSILLVIPSFATYNHYLTVCVL